MRAGVRTLSPADFDAEAQPRLHQARLADPTRILLLCAVHGDKKNCISWSVFQIQPTLLMTRERTPDPPVGAARAEENQWLFGLEFLKYHW